MKKLTGPQLRGVLRGMIREYVANTDGDPRKEDHADPTGKTWDAGLDEVDEVDHADPTAKDWDKGLDEGHGGGWKVSGNTAEGPGVDVELDDSHLEVAFSHGTVQIPLNVLYDLLKL